MNEGQVKSRMRLTRELIALLPASIDDPGPMDSEADLEKDDFYGRSTDKLMADIGESDELWVFAVGSLIWKPRFPHVEQRRALVKGWHRAFCIGPDQRYRGNPDAHGLMLSLDEGGECEGVIFRIDPANLRDNLFGLIEAEPPVPPVWVDAKTDLGTVPAIAFNCPKTFVGYEGGLDINQVADRLTLAVGMWGSMADYLYNTVVNLETYGIHDEYLWALQELVAERLENVAKQKTCPPDQS